MTDQWMPTGTKWALSFDSKYIMTNTDVPIQVEVLMSGRVVATINDDDGSCQLDGVYPGSVSVQASSLAEAGTDINISISHILSDIVDYCDEDMDKASVVIEDFFYRSTGARAKREWEAARIHRNNSDILDLEQAAVLKDPDVKVYARIPAHVFPIVHEVKFAVAC